MNLTWKQALNLQFIIRDLIHNELKKLYPEYSFKIEYLDNPQDLLDSAIRIEIETIDGVKGFDVFYKYGTLTFEPLE